MASFNLDYQIAYQNFLEKFKKKNWKMTNFTFAYNFTINKYFSNDITRTNKPLVLSLKRFNYYWDTENSDTLSDGLNWN